MVAQFFSVLVIYHLMLDEKKQKIKKVTSFQENFNRFSTKDMDGFKKVTIFSDFTNWNF